MDPQIVQSSPQAGKPAARPGAPSTPPEAARLESNAPSVQAPDCWGREEPRLCALTFPRLDGLPCEPCRALQLGQHRQDLRKLSDEELCAGLEHVGRPRGSSWSGECYGPAHCSRERPCYACLVSDEYRDLSYRERERTAGLVEAICCAARWHPDELAAGFGMVIVRANASTLGGIDLLPSDERAEVEALLAKLLAPIFRKFLQAERLAARATGKEVRRD